MDTLAESDPLFTFCTLARRARKIFGEADVLFTQDELYNFDFTDQEPHSLIRVTRENRTDILEKNMPEARHAEFNDLWEWKNGIAHFHQLQRKEAENGDDWRHFSATMGAHQATSWRLIREWLDGAYHLQELATAARSVISSRTASRPIPRPPGSGSRWDKCWLPGEALLERSTYHHALGRLFSVEFLDTLSDGIFLGDVGVLWRDPYRLELDQVRNWACDQAICQAIAHRVYSALQDGNGCSAEDPVEYLLEKSVSYPDPCPWLQDANLDRYPAYLWSVVERRTIETKFVGTHEPYACVSHTWGRWKKDLMARVKGCPWDVPENSIWSVEDIPYELGVLGQTLGIDYVWFDLVCIPQTRSGILGQIAQEEISHQAAIFKGSSISVAWLNYVDDWEAEQSLVEWLCLKFLAITSDWGLYETAEKLSELQHRSDVLPKLTYHPSHDKYFQGSSYVRNDDDDEDDKDMRSPWFSSLWTLQEVCLCPRMMLMSRDWELLEDSSGSPVTLDQLVALSMTVAKLLTTGTQRARPGLQIESPIEDLSAIYPDSVSLLTLLVVDAQPVGQSRSRTAILQQANLRQCTGCRAEAIMSTVDVTDWYAIGQDNERDLVLGVYPVAFVEEAASKFGPEFALAQKDIASASAASMLGYFNGTARGSLLPFAELDTGSAGAVHMSPLPVLDAAWLSVFDSWEFLCNGSVRMTQAVIVGKKVRNSVEIAPDYPDLTIALYTHSDQPVNHFQHEIRLRDWLEEQPAEFCTFAIAISMTLGIVLQGFSANVDADVVCEREIERGVAMDMQGSHVGEVEQRPLRLVKIGSFKRHQLTLQLPFRQVDWIVL